jgi:hypothetical protein
LVDVVGIGYGEYTPAQRDQVVAAFPRDDNFKNDFVQVQTCSALKKPSNRTPSLVGKSGSDGAFDKPMSKDEVLKISLHKSNFSAASSDSLSTASRIGFTVGDK